jgi:L-histidine N-alpha-methyltransferase
MAILRNSLSAVKTPATSRYQDLIDGLETRPRRIPSKYFYDDRGSRIFSHITELNEYYPTRCEAEILGGQSEAILDACGARNGEGLNIVELGAGDGRKIVHLLRAAKKRAQNKLCYQPVDISLQALRDVKDRVQDLVEGVTVEPRLLDMEHDLESLKLSIESRNLILYLGSSIGNFTPDEQRRFLRRMRAAMGHGDFICIGFDLKKDPHILRMAYDDPGGVTKEFNMNLLRRLNRELGADFNEANFAHVASYNPGTGSMESWLVSQKEQAVDLPLLERTLKLDAFEGIHVETSWKFSRREIVNLARDSGFFPVQSFVNKSDWFVDELWKP